jgi:hypothetical protein
MMNVMKPESGLRVIDSRPHVIADAPALESMCEIDTIEEVAARYTRWINGAMVDYVSQHHPISDPAASTWVWLRADGVVYGEILRDPTYAKQGSAKSGELLLEVFNCLHHANPNSNFYKRVPCEFGSFVGVIPAREDGLPQSWDRLKPFGLYPDQVAAWGALGFQRFYIEPMSGKECAEIYNSPERFERFQRKILRWMLTGKCQSLLQHLSLEGLRDALERHGSAFGNPSGMRKIIDAANSKLKETLMNGS